MPLTGTQVALREQVSEDLNDITVIEYAYFATLLGLDAYYKQAGLRFEIGGPMAGEGWQIDFRTGRPTVRGVDAMNRNFDVLVAPLTQAMTIVSGTVVPAAYEAYEVLQKYYMNRISGKLSSVENFVTKTAKAIRDSLYSRWTNHAFPPTNMQPTLAAGAAPAQQAIDRIMALAYPLQNGYANNAATGTGTYNYFTIDMNLSAYSNMKAYNRGTVAAPFGTPGIQNLSAAKAQCHKRGGRPDVLIVDTDTFAFLKTLADDPVRYPFSETTHFGSNFAVICGMVMICEAGMDMLSDGFSDGDTETAGTTTATEYREMYGITSSEYAFRATATDEDDLDRLKYPRGASFDLLQGYWEAGHWTENPRHHFRLFQVTGVT